MPTVKDLREYLDTLDDNDVIAYSIWNVDDIKERAEYDENICTDEDAKAILEKMHVESGVSSDDIDYLVSQLPSSEEGDDNDATS